MDADPHIGVNSKYPNGFSKIGEKTSKEIKKSENKELAKYLDNMFELCCVRILFSGGPRSLVHKQRRLALLLVSKKLSYLELLQKLCQSESTMTHLVFCV